MEAPENLPELLKGWARDASDDWLLFDVAAAALAITGVLFWRPWGWRAMIAAAVCVAAFGAWGLADRELFERGAAAGTLPKLLRAGRVVAEVVGWLGLITLVFSVLGLAIGTWIS